MARTTERHTPRTTPPDKNSPRQLPPDLQAVAALAHVGRESPTLAIEEATAAQTIADIGAPALTPPTPALLAAEGEEGITAWINGVKIVALWVNSSARNAWAFVGGLGWRRIVFTNDSAFLNVTAMLSHARQVNATCNVRIESDNVIHEAYVW
jgi:hypothetical protein